MNAIFSKELNEQFSRDWSGELLNFPLKFADGELTTVDLAFFVNDRQLPSQITDVEQYASGAIMALNAWVVLDLKADERLTLELKPRKAAENIPFEIDGNRVKTGKFDASLAESGTYFDNIPAVIERIEKCGKTLLCGYTKTTRAVDVLTTISEFGEIFVRVKYEVKMGGIVVSTTIATLQNGQEYITFSESSNSRDELYTSYEISSELGFDTVTTEGYGHSPRQVLYPITYSRDEDLAVVDFNSGHHQMSLSWFGAYNASEGEEFIGALEINGAKWDYLYINRLRLHQSVPQALEILSPVYAGHKEWALLITDKKSAVGEGLSYLANVHQRLTEVPYQKLKDWVMAWEDGGQQPIYFTEESLQRAKDKCLREEKAKIVFSEYKKTVDSGIGVFGGHANDLITLWVAFGDEDYAKRAAEALYAEAVQAYNDFWSGGTFSRMVIFNGRSMKVWLRVYDLLVHNGFLEDNKKKEIKRLFALFAYGFADEDFFPTIRSLSAREDPESYFLGELGEKIGDAMCPPNFATEYYTSYGCFGAQFAAHPMANKWVEKAIYAFDMQLKHDYFDSGVYIESPNYHHHSFAMLNQLTHCLYTVGAKNYYKHPRFKAQYGYFCDIATPQVLPNDDAKLMVNSKLRMLDYDSLYFSMLPGNGNTGHNCSDIPLPVDLMTGALMYAKIDPELSSRCYYTWCMAGRPVNHHYDTITYLLSDIEVYSPAFPDAGVNSKVIGGSFVTMRANLGLCDEIYVLVKNGYATHHNDFDEGGFTIWAYGSPLCSDYGYHADHGDLKSVPVVSTWQHNCVEFDNKSSGYLAMEVSQSPAFFVSEKHADLLVSNLKCFNLRDSRNITKQYLDQRVPCEEITYYRYTLFVKPDYLIIFDNIISCPYFHSWNLHCQSEDVLVDGNEARFSGKFGVDLSAQFIVPQKAEIESGSFSVQQYIRAKQYHSKDWRVLVEPHKRGASKGFEISTRANDRVMLVRCAEYTDEVILANSPFEYNGKTVQFSVKRTYNDGTKPTETLLEKVVGSFLD